MTEVNETYGCILSKFYIKPQLRNSRLRLAHGCILSKFYIKPQRFSANVYNIFVVSYRNSTSNHNLFRSVLLFCMLYLIEILHQTTTVLAQALSPVQVVSYRNSTSNHNAGQPRATFSSLYLIEILHQTTTFGVCSPASRRCILSKFYIKPQLAVLFSNVLGVVSYRNSTSNHNKGCSRASAKSVVSYRNSTSNHNPVSTTLPSSALYLIEILHQTTTQIGDYFMPLCCILSKFYIKPQRLAARTFRRGVVSYRNSTSNHNRVGD